MGKIFKNINNNIQAEIEEKTCGETTRTKILAAARNVFARHAFHAASVRMIAQEGKFAHGIIRYHFPSKAALFEAIVREACEDFYQQNLEWLKEVSGMPLEESFSIYLDRLLAYNKNNPQALQMLNQNLGQADKAENTPGYGYILGLVKRTREEFSQGLSTKAIKDLADRFSDAFYGLVFYFLGASSCQAQLLKIDPTSPEYAEWVKKTMQVVFLPLVKEIFNSSKKPGFIFKDESLMKKEERDE